MRYKFKNPEFLPIKNAKEADAQRLGEAIAAIEARDGEVKTDAIWEAAKDRRHPFHKHIDWDKDDASEKWQKYQCRKIIGCVVMAEEPCEEMQAFVSLPSDNGRSYRSTGRIADSDYLLQKTLETALADLEAFEYRYRMFVHFVEEARSIRAKIEAKLQRQKEFADRKNRRRDAGRERPQA